jgi:hypothetical protein
MTIPRYMKMSICPSLELNQGTPPVDLLVLLGGGSSKTHGGISGGAYPFVFLGGDVLSSAVYNSHDEKEDLNG